LLGNSLKDAVNVCNKQLSDFQLAVTLARVVEQRDDGPILIDILKNTVLPIAFSDGNRWLASWAFWMLHRRDLAVRVLLVSSILSIKSTHFECHLNVQTPLQDIAKSLDIRVTDIGEPHYDDPSLVLLFSQLKSKTLQAAKGTSEISGRAEFHFVLQMTRVFCRMGMWRVPHLFSLVDFSDMQDVMFWHLTWSAHGPSSDLQRFPATYQKHRMHLQLTNSRMLRPQAR
jgi:hypothetical protein